MEIGIGLFLAGLTPAVTAIVWSVNQQGRINTHDEKFRMLDDYNAQQRIDVKDRLGRIEDKVDAILKAGFRA